MAALSQQPPPPKKKTHHYCFAPQVSGQVNSAPKMLRLYCLWPLRATSE